jgi:PAS domain S-box-containing protein
VTLLAGDARRQRASQVAGLAAAAIVVAALFGWWASLPLLSSWGSVAMKPMDALILAALGFALMHPGRNSRFAFATGLTMAAVAVLAFGVNRGLVHLPQAVAPAPEAAWPDAGPGMALAIAPVAGALALTRFERHHLVAIMLAGLGCIMAIFGIVEYLAGIDTLHGTVRSPGLPTAVSLICIVIGIVLRIGTMPAPRKSRPLSHLLIVLSSAIIAPLLLLALYTGFRITDAQFDQARKDLMNEAHTLSAEVDYEIRGEIERLQALAASPSLRRGDFAEFQRQAEAPLSTGRSGNVMLLDRDMRQLVNTWVQFGTPLPKAIVREPVERALVTGQPQVTGVFMGPMSHQFLFSVAVPVQIDGASRYALVRSPNRSLITGLLKAHELPPGWHAVVADVAHRIIARSGGDDGFIGTELPERQWHHAGATGVFEFVDSDGRPSLEAYATSKLTGWEAVVWEPKALFEAPVRALWGTIALVALLAFTLVAGLALWLSRIIARSVGQMAGAAIALERGGPLPVGDTPVDEVNALMKELREAAIMRQATEDLLRGSEARFRAMFEVSSVGKIETECETGRFLAANAAMCKLVGYSEAELLATTAFDITHPDERERDRSLIRRLLVGELPVFDVEKRYIRKDGTTVWVRVTANVIRDESGRPLRSMAVIQDLTARKQAEQALQASKERLQLAMDAARLGSFRYDPLSGALSGDARVKEIFDFDAAQEEARIEELVERIHPDDVERFWTVREAALDPADPQPYANEYRIKRRDGSVRWVEVLGRAYFEGAGPERRAVNFVGTVADVTERKEREEKEHLLMREINHRAKNMLSVVDAIAHQTAARNPEDFVERFSERVQALSANQDLLIRNEWNGVGVVDLVRAQLAHFADLIGFRIALQGPDLRLNPAAAQAIGLALHELATNAGKYGALSTVDGRVDVGWGIDGRTFTVRWTERGGPPVPASRPRGFGTIVIETMAERSLAGTVDLDYAPSGVTWRLTCPAANALEAGRGR